MAANKGKQAEDTSQAEPDQAVHRPRPFWSGIIAFGLVSLPVSLFPANRGKSVSLAMVDAEGARLRRRYFCEKEDRMLERDDIVRGYPVDKDRYVLVEDEELEALAPDKTREIDLGRFVPIEEINPVFFERGYFLAPDSGSNKAYRLLARSMEEQQRAGIATFVMRDREYIIAIMAEDGILRAETLRFHDELRSPAQVGLPTLDKADAKLSATFRKAIKARSKDELNPERLREQQVDRLKALVNDKLANDRDVVKEAEPEYEEEDSNVVDLLQVLKERLEGKKPDVASASEKKSKPTAASKASKESSALNRDELYEEAKKKHIPGRSKMSKQELADALRKAG